MAEISMSAVGSIIEENGFVTVQEPAVGAGGMVIAMADVIEGLAFDPAKHLWIEATELSRSTYHMGFIQINARGVAGRVICGNSLSMETYSSPYTAAAAGFYAVNGDPFAKQREAARVAANQQQKWDAKLEQDRKERLRTLGQTAEPRPATHLGLFD